MTLANLDVSTIEEVKGFEKGKPIKIKGTVKTALQPRKLWKGISQFIVLEDNTDSIGCNVSPNSLDEGYDLGETLVIVGEVNEYPEKDRQTKQLTGKLIKTVNGYVESSFINADEDLETEKRSEVASEPKTEKIVIKQKAYVQNDYWKDKFLLDVERQEMYRGNNETIIRECAVKAVTELAVARLSTATPMEEKQYFEFADKIVDWIKDDADFKLKTEANLIISGLSPMKKAEIVGWIEKVRKDTAIEDDEEFLIQLNVQVLSAQTIKELRETVDTMMKYFHVTKGE